MPDAKESSQDARPGGLDRLEARLDAFEADRGAKPSVLGGGASAGEAYSLLGQMLGGILGGVGFGWLFDQIAHTGPWGLIGGLLIGTGLSIYATVHTALRISARAAAISGPNATVPDDEDDD